ncbi:MAG: MlaE family ABC transporter permease [Verrucomicrobiia bacterium]
MINYLQLNLEILYWLAAGPFKKKGFKSLHVFQQMMRIGVDALPMVCLTTFSIGLTLAMQGAGTLEKMGAEQFVPNLVSISLLRELGPLLVAMIVIGRSGSSVTAELGAMKVAEEIEALEVMAIDPIRYLIVPRFLAMMIMVPALTVFGNCVAMVGGWTICHFALDMSTPYYIVGLIEPAELDDLYSGIVKSVAFAWLIATIACNSGLEVTGGAEGVGRATTQSVVYSLLSVLITNAILTAFFFFL